MKIHPNTISNSSIAIFIWDESDNCGGSAILFGTARFLDGEFFVERDQEPFRMPIPESAWENLRINQDKEEGTDFGTADHIVMLRLGMIPEGESTDDYQQVDIPILNQ